MPLTLISAFWRIEVQVIEINRDPIIFGEVLPLRVSFRSIPTGLLNTDEPSSFEMLSGQAYMPPSLVSPSLLIIIMEGQPTIGRDAKLSGLDHLRSRLKHQRGIADTCVKRASMLATPEATAGRNRARRRRHRARSRSNRESRSRLGSLCERG